MQQEIPYGFCRCGCGQQTPIAQKNRPNRGWIKGEPRPFIKGHHKPKYACLEDYFWTYATPANKNVCWEWQGAKTEAGYGVMNYRGKMYYAHRTSWEIANSKSLPKGKFACHKCDNPGCVNPSHIWPGGLHANVQDMVEKQRHAYGERSGIAKLTEKQIAQILELAEQGVTYKEIGEKFQVNGAYISSILTGRRWLHLTKGKAIRRNRTMSEDEVRQIRHLHESTNLSMRKIAARFGTDHNVISGIVKGVTYRHVT